MKSIKFVVVELCCLSESQMQQPWPELGIPDIFIDPQAIAATLFPPRTSRLNYYPPP